jgi:C_GCAxxG_C_C family probable redox protein
MKNGSMKSRMAFERFLNDHNCCQSILEVFAAEFGLGGATALRIATGFGGGMGRMGEVCGAVTGAFMALGLKYGNPESNAEAKGRTYEAVREFSRLFKERHGSILCRKLLGCDIGTPEGMAEAKNKDLFNTLCATLVRDAAEILEGM